MELNNIPRLFGINGDCISEDIRSGHINKTYLCSCGGEKYIIQNIDRKVFPFPENIDSNIRKISSAFISSGEERVTVPRFLESEGRYHIMTEDEVWRMYPYIPQTASPFTNKNYSCGLAFGTFIRILNEKPVKLRSAGNPPHSYSKVFSLLSSIAGNSVNKKIDSTVLSRLSSLDDTLSQVFTADFPKRNVHNDAKTANVIIGEQLTVIDLDTAMLGYPALDYGDLIRSVCQGSSMDTAAVRDATRGFAAGLDGLLTSDELDSLYYGLIYAVGELAARYLLDYVSEAGYFKDKTPAGCLARANELLGQLRVFINSGDELTELIYSSFGKK
ncbi:MAG TPA: phosphotransferase [Ruminococcus sp.]|nr:phosphotransferase [Ruminococcus sp.]